MSRQPSYVFVKENTACKCDFPSTNERTSKSSRNPIDLHAPIFRGRLEAASWGLLLPTTRKVCVRCLLTFSLVNVLQVNNQLTFTCVCVVGSHFSVDSANPTSDLLPALVAAHNN